MCKIYRSKHIKNTIYFFLGITFFRDFFGKKQERITTAYITAPGPVQAELVEGWNRNGIDGHTIDLPYNGYINPYEEYPAFQQNH